MQKLMGLMALGLGMILLSGCGDDNDTPIVEPTIQGAVVGSHYEGAWVCVDTNLNDRCDGEEKKTVSDANGSWKLDDPQNSELNIVAEIYVDNIKHSSSGSTLVEEPMIFIASLKGEVDGELIVSPISTMVYRYMQENSASFEVAKESVAKELGVSSETLLTNYNVENPSPDHATLQQHSATETEKLGLGMSYHDNDVIFDFKFAGQVKNGGRYTIADFYVPSAQDPNHHIFINKVVDMHLTGDDSAKLTFVIGRKGSTHVANWWSNRVNTNECNYNFKPDKLNFAFIGYLTLNVDGKYYVFSDFALAQGHSFIYNNWWFGGKNCLYDDSAYAIICNGKDGDGNVVKFKFTDNSSNTSNNHIGVYRWETSPEPN